MISSNHEQHGHASIRKRDRIMFMITTGGGPWSLGLSAPSVLEGRRLSPSSPDSLYIFFHLSLRPPFSNGRCPPTWPHREELSADGWRRREAALGTSKVALAVKSLFRHGPAQPQPAPPQSPVRSPPPTHLERNCGGPPDGWRGATTMRGDSSPVLFNPGPPWSSPQSWPLHSRSIRLHLRLPATVGRSAHRIRSAAAPPFSSKKRHIDSHNDRCPPELE